MMPMYSHKQVTINLLLNYSIPAFRQTDFFSKMVQFVYLLINSNVTILCNLKPLICYTVSWICMTQHKFINKSFMRQNAWVTHITIFTLNDFQLSLPHSIVKCVGKHNQQVKKTKWFECKNFKWNMKTKL